jgi:predicted O-linked N-acetylglucosamine transferase (SPINDLY family)
MHPALSKAIQDARAGRIEQGISSLRARLRLHPKDIEAIQILALLLVQSGRRDEALYQLGRAVELQPNLPSTRNNYGTTLFEAGRTKDAIVQFRRACELDPSYRLAWLGLASALNASADPVGALAACDRGLALRPDWPELLGAKAGALASALRLDEALALLEQTSARHPDRSALRSDLLLMSNYTERTPEELFNLHRRLAHVGPFQPSAPASDRDAERPLRIGVLSGDLRSHSVGFFAQALFRNRPAAHRMIVFSAAPPQSDDALESGFRASADEWIEAAAMSDEALDAAIRAQCIDVLVELSGHTSAGRLQALARKPAPVIVTAIGYPSTTGHPAIDARIVDSTTDPHGSDTLATERLVRLDPCFLCFTPPTGAPEPALPDAGEPITFGSFNLAAKISPGCLGLWSAVLAATPNSRLLVKSRSVVSESMRQRLLEMLAAGGIDATRIETVGYTRSVEDHLKLYSRVHVALDTMPYNGTTTTCEALWMGVPVVARLGNRHAARVSASLVGAAGFPELVARSDEDFVRIASTLASDRSRLGTFRASARATLAASPLLDERAYAERFHAALRQLWRGFCSGRGDAA